MSKLTILDTDSTIGLNELDGVQDAEKIAGAILVAIKNVRKANNKAFLLKLEEELIGKKGGCSDKVMDEEDDINALEQRLVAKIGVIKDRKDYSFLSGIVNVILGGVVLEQPEVEEFNISSLDFHKLTPYSKKKVVAHLLKEKYPDKHERKRLLHDILDSSDIIDSSNMAKLGINPILIKGIDAFGASNESSYNQVLGDFLNFMSPEEQYTFIKVLEKSGVPDGVVRRFLNEAEKQPKGGLVIENVKGFDNRRDHKLSEELSQMIPKERNGFSDFNPSILDIDITLGMKLFGEKRLKEIYRQYFLGISDDILSTVDGEKTTFNQLLSLDREKLTGKKLAKDENRYIPQFLLEWDLDKDGDEKMLIDIVNLLKEEGYDTNMGAKSEFSPLTYPRTFEGAQEYRGHFSDGGEGMEGNSILYIKSKDGKEKKLRLSLRDFTQDEYIYLRTQIGHYLKRGHFINKNQLYFEIYHKYNQMTFGGNEQYDITIFEKEYAQLMEKLIIPNSIEVKGLDVKGDNILLAGLYGTGKSQFCSQVLTSKSFEYEGKEFNLNANVITLDLQMFKGLLINGSGGFRTKLDEIYDKTGAPILLVIEDIDTLINEKITGGNDELAQAMTTFFEGIGSLPISVMATANDPTKISERLIRPNRLYEIINFSLPDQNTRKNILKEHLKRNNLELSTEVFNSLLELQLFKKGTASHIAKFVREIVDRKNILFVMNSQDESLSDDEIIEIAKNINISVNDIEEVIKTTGEWLKRVTGREVPRGMGFVQEQK